eukprot:scaffold2422_cov171-Amphora_coffeaeformis.AAC.6
MTSYRKSPERANNPLATAVLAWDPLSCCLEQDDDARGRRLILSILLLYHTPGFIAVLLKPQEVLPAQTSEGFQWKRSGWAFDETYSFFCCLKQHKIIAASCAATGAAAVVKINAGGRRLI